VLVRGGISRHFCYILATRSRESRGESRGYIVEAPGVEPLATVQAEMRRDADLPNNLAQSFGHVAPVRSRAGPQDAALRCRVGAQGGHKLSAKLGIVIGPWARF
jgi:hypothetical protein